MTKDNVPVFDVFLNFGTLCLNSVDSFVLLLNENTHLQDNGLERDKEKVMTTYVIEQLRKFRDRPLNALNVFVSFLHFTIRAAGFTVPIRVEELEQIP